MLNDTNSVGDMCTYETGKFSMHLAVTKTPSLFQEKVMMTTVYIK